MIKFRLILLCLVAFLAGSVITLYPHVRGQLADQEMKQTAEIFLSKASMEISEKKAYQDLWEDMTAYNADIYAEGQAGLSSADAYEVPSFDLTEYGLEDEVFGVISIPSLDLELPLYLGTTKQHLADGAAVLSQTSIPIGGSNTNSVIAGHRGWRGADYFRYITELQPGDEVIITNLWETLTYVVVGAEIIEPNAVDAILIQNSRDMLTLLTCHPYASGGKQRYIVFCERKAQTNQQE